MSPSQMLKHALRDGVATVTIANPPLNLLTVEMLEEMADHIAGCAGARVLVLAAEGKVFSAGVDTTEDSPVDTIAAFRRVFDELSRFDGITIAAVDGVALGGGCELACACDVIVAGARAEFGQPNADMQVMPPLLWPRLFNDNNELRASGEDLRRSGMNVRAVRRGGLRAELTLAIKEYKEASALAVAYAKHARQRGVRGNIDASLRQVQALYLTSKKSMARARVASRPGFAGLAWRRKEKTPGGN